MNYYQDPRVGLYIRLSRDDLRAGESMSVENQRIFLNNYAKEQGWSNVTEYVDDGYTGVNFDRPSFKRMMEDVKKQKINIIVCKDMSRFGRNYIQVGEFTDYILPSAGCALIALNDGVDTRKNIDNDMTPFRNLFNELYCKDIYRDYELIDTEKSFFRDETGIRLTAKLKFRGDIGKQQVIYTKEDLTTNDNSSIVNNNQ